MIKLAMEAAKMGVGAATKIASAVKQNKANTLANRAGIVQQNMAKKQFANTLNPMGNAATQAAVNAMQGNLDASAAQNSAMNAVTGATDEMALAQNQQQGNIISGVYADIAKNASNAYNGALQGVANSESDLLKVRSAQKAAQAAQLSKAGDNAFGAMKGDNIVEGMKSIGG